MAPTDFSSEYSQRSDDEVLSLAADRASLRPEAVEALDAELHRRNLTGSDQAKYQQFVKHNELREARKRRRKIAGTWRDWDSWIGVFWGLAAIAVIVAVYLALPSRYRMKPDWQEAAFHVMFASVFIAAFGRGWWLKLRFWMSLILSSAIHLMILHAWVKRFGDFGRNSGDFAILLGLVLFLVAYGILRLVGRNLYGEELRDHSQSV